MPLVAGRTKQRILSIHALHPVAIGSLPRASRRGSIKAHSDFWGSRIGQITCLRFHPSRSLLAVGASNDHLSVFSYDEDAWTDKIML